MLKPGSDFSTLGNNALKTAGSMRGRKDSLLRTLQAAGAGVATTLAVLHGSAAAMGAPQASRIAEINRTSADAFSGATESVRGPEQGISVSGPVRGVAAGRNGFSKPAPGA